MSDQLLQELSDHIQQIRSDDWGQLGLEDLCLDNLFLSVRLKDGHCGLAMNYDLEGHHGISAAQIERTRRQILSQLDHDPLLWNYLRKDTPSDAHNALWVAVLSALSAPVLRDPDRLAGLGLRSQPGRVRLRELGAEHPAPIVTIVGFGGYLEEALAQDWLSKVNCIDFLVSSDDFRQRNPYPFRLKEEASQRMQVVYDDGSNAPGLLEEADILCVSASTLPNRSLQGLLPAARGDRMIVLEGPSGGVLPGPLFERGITHLVHNPVDVDFVSLCHRFSRQERQGLQRISSGRFIDIILPEQRTVTRVGTP
ncbi:hypothetical protein JST97_34285 [bacterium]|nr:hypothetical protein [bacterium]